MVVESCLHSPLCDPQLNLGGTVMMVSIYPPVWWWFGRVGGGVVKFVYTEVSKKLSSVIKMTTN